MRLCVAVRATSIQFVYSTTAIGIGEPLIAAASADERQDEEERADPGKHREQGTHDRPDPTQQECSDEEAYSKVDDALTDLVHYTPVLSSQ